ncbi:PEP-CTERM sorting domain-containing protein [Methylophilus sp. OH31]|uniref:PEP-CTERM sorting domain-containing protein n=1 Tax=Methylophilus sp. OH31 TaxID=1387312 RepID=UPI0004665EF6|nr:PEP-CTERM sorting domain-containing protein [Methylophilus sp. OH31]
MQFKFKCLVTALALASVIGNAHATALLVNSPTANVDIVASGFGGTLLDTATTVISNLSYNGTARTAVYSTASGLDFYYQFTNNATSQNGIDRMTAFDFSSLGTNAVDVYQTAAGFGIFTNGTEISTYADRTMAGVIGLNFSPVSVADIPPGTTSFIQIIRTNATSYQPGNFGILDGIGSNAAGFSPTTTVPEASANIMMLAGIGLIGLIGSRRLKK